MLPAKGVQVPIRVIGGDERRDLQRQTFVRFHARFCDPTKAARCRTEQVRVTFREDRREPKRLQIGAGNPKRPSVE